MGTQPKAFLTSIAVQEEAHASTAAHTVANHISIARVLAERSNQGKLPAPSAIT